MWQSAHKGFKQGVFELDPYLSEKTDDRIGLTLLARVTGSVANHFQYFIEQLNRHIPNQYCYPKTDFHITVMSIVTCRTGYKFDSTLKQDYLKMIEQCLVDCKSFEINFNGITASSGAILACGYPLGSGLSQIRQNLREIVKASNLENSIDTRYPIKTAHSTLLRFCEQPEHPKKLVTFLQKNLQKEFTNINIQSLELVVNDWYQSRERTTVLGEFSLS